MKTLGPIVESLRMKQWIKNLFVFAGLVFSRNIFHADMFLTVLYTFVIFCLVSSGMYIFNDIFDQEKDSRHPLKSERPIPSGRLKPSTAAYAAIVLAASGLLFASLLDFRLFYIVAAYILLQLAYSKILKNVVFLDVFSISLGFILRVVAGAAVINIYISSWLIICTLLISMFLGLGKRRHELLVLKEDAVEHRSVLKDYSPYLLDHLMNIMASTTIICYILYTTSHETITKFGTSNLIFTVPFVVYGIFRYLYLIHMKEKGGSPEDIFSEDYPMLAAVFLWAGTAAIIIYF